MIQAKVDAALREAYKVKVTDAVAGAPAKVLHENEDGSGGRAPSGTAEKFVRVWVVPGPTQQITLGSPATYRTSGLLMIGTFWPFAQGDGEQKRFCDEVARAFRPSAGAAVEYEAGRRVTLQAASINRVGRSGVGAYWQVNVSVPWYADWVG